MLDSIKHALQLNMQMSRQACECRWIIGREGHLPPGLQEPRQGTVSPCAADARPSQRAAAPAEPAQPAPVRIPPED